jgi:hypothetical protein
VQAREGALTLQKLAGLGAETLMEKALSGELRGRHLWTAYRGAGEYRAAVAAGDIATEEEQARRVRVCGGCGRRTDEPKAVGVAHWCGEAFEDRSDAGGTCGCLVALTVDGVMHAAGRAVVGSEGCPLGLW